MWAFAKAILLLAKFTRRQAIATEQLVALYKLDLESRNVVAVHFDPNYKPKPDDMSEIMYGVKEPDEYEDTFKT